SHAVLWAEAVRYSANSSTPGLGCSAALRSAAAAANTAARCSPSCGLSCSAALSHCERSQPAEAAGSPPERPGSVRALKRASVEAGSSGAAGGVCMQAASSAHAAAAGGPRRVVGVITRGLYSRHLGQVATVLTPQLEARVLEATRRGPRDGTTHWSTRRLAEHLGVSHMMVARVWRKHGLKPQRIERYMASNDPDFEKKAA